MTTEMQAQQVTRGGSIVAHMITEDGIAWCLQYTPEETSLGGIGSLWSQIDRQGLKPLVRRESGKARTITFSHEINHRLVGHGNLQSVTANVRALADLADAAPARKVRFIGMSNDVETRGWWVIDELNVTVRERDEQQQMKRVELSWRLIEHIDERPQVSRVPPPPPPPAAPAATANGSITGAGTQEYTVKKGDNLWNIALKYLGSGPRWKEIYDANASQQGWKPPEMWRGMTVVWIFPGNKIKIPAK